MTLGGPYRVHIAPQGYEIERVVRPAKTYEADKVILLVHGEDSPQGKDCREEVIQQLENVGIEVDDRQIDLFDPNKSLQKFIEIIEEHPDDNINVNISTGSKITAITGTIACMITGATPYYTKASDYGDEVVSKDAGDSIELPRYPIDSPEEQLVHILSFLLECKNHDEPASKKDIIEYAYENDLKCVSGSERKDPSKSYDLITPVISKLKEWGLASERRFENKQIIEITDNGEQVLNLYDYIVDTEIGASLDASEDAG